MGYYDSYGFSYDASNVATGLAGVLGGLLIFILIICLIALAVSIVQIVATWKVYKKAGKGGWEAIIPFYCNWVLVEISGLSGWWFLLFFAPLVSSFIGLDWLGYIVYLVVTFNCYYNLSKRFNKGVGFAICLTLFTPICMMILGFSKKNVYNNVMVSNNGVFSPTNGANNNGNINNNYQNTVQPQQNYNKPINNVQPIPVVTPVQPTVESVMNGPIVEPVQNTVQNPMFESIPQTLVESNVQQPVQSDIQSTQVVQPVVEQPQAVQSSNCSKCGSPVNHGDRFCMNCGTQL